MIAEKIVQEVRRLLAEGVLSQRKIAQRTGISRGTVGAIASGKRPDSITSEPLEEEDEPMGPPERCSGCGGLVYLPCRLCRTRKADVKSRQSTARQRMAEVNERLELNLRPEHHARYEEVRVWRRERETVGQTAIVSAS